ncbi:hypothetical protein [Streptomyces sp. H39-C1]|uniref:hypothetical protein n=1 Tax=Streptomyces sp. H39-C1 TaxID=3004355 RepID=UPI0022AEFE3A|nr:hypothetical protein [Streptomyces sp. H39-C1]MCZ4098104.1 hypothetical protein [Streptomyces sp. H39-C1]
MARNGINQRELDKWAKGLVKEANKSLERAARRNPSRVPVQFETTPTGSGAPNGEAIESSAHLARLLLWLDAYAQQHPGRYIDVTRFVEEHELTDDASVLALQLEQRGLANLARAWGDAVPHVQLTDEGRVAVHALKNRQKDRAARLRHTMNAFLRWLYDTAGDQVPTNPALFLATPGSYFAGADVSGADLHQALAYLTENGLIEPIDTDPSTVAITPRGVSCALAGGSVQDDINQPTPSDNGPVFHIATNNGNIAANSTGFTQNAVTQTGFDPAQILAAVNLLQQLAPSLTPNAGEQQVLLTQVQELQAAATVPAPDRGLVRRVAGGVISTIRGLAHSPDVQRLALEAVEQGIQGL